MGVPSATIVVVATGNDIVWNASKEIGYTESPRGSNKTKYGKLLKINGQPWCATFVTWVYSTVGIDLRRYSDNPFYTPNLWSDLNAKGWGVNERAAKPGDIAFFDFAGGKRRIEHVGIIVENRYPNFVTIEGNTSGGNNTNGGAVMRRGRNASQIVAVAHCKLLDGTPLPPKGPPVPAPTPAAQAELVKLVAAVNQAKKSTVGFGHVTSGNAVKFVQQGINNLRIPGIHLLVDGQFGNATRDAVKWVQGTRGLHPDGIVGSATWSILYP